MIKTLKNKKVYNKEFNLLGEYIFCFHKNFENIDTLNSFNNIKGLKYILNGFVRSQKKFQILLKNVKKMKTKMVF